MRILIAPLAAPLLWRASRYRRDSVEAQTCYAVSLARKWESGLYYMLLAGFLALMMHDTHEMLQALRPVRAF